MHQQATAAVRDELQRCVDSGRLPGIQYVVVDASDLRFRFCGGRRDLRTGEPVRDDTTLMASSSTKVYTATAILQLVQAGKLQLDAPLSACYTDHPYGDALTIRQLLGHTAGVPNPLPLKWLHLAADHARFDEAAALRDVLRRHPALRHRPGTRSLYSNIGYWLLGKVVESVSGSHFVDYLRTQVFEPLGMSASEAAFHVADPRRHAVGCQAKYTPSGILLRLLMDRRMVDGSVGRYLTLHAACMNGPAYGGLVCTANALSRLLQDLLRPDSRLLGDAMRQQFFAPHRTADGAATGTTLGWRMGQLARQAYFGKPGGGPGFRSSVRLYPAKGFGVAWLANETAINEQQLNQLSDCVDRHWLR